MMFQTLIFGISRYCLNSIEVSNYFIVLLQRL